MTNIKIDEWINELNLTIEKHLAQYCNYIFTYRHSKYAKNYPEYEGIFLNMKKEEIKIHIDSSAFRQMYESMFGERIEKRVEDIGKRVHKHFEKSPHIIPSIFNGLIKTFLQIYKKMKEHAQKYLGLTLKKPTENEIIESIKKKSDQFCLN